MKGKMKAIVKTRPEKGAELLEVDIPQIKPDEVLVKVESASICGTDLHIWEWNEWAQNRIKVPQIMGHEVAGTVVEVGSQVDWIKEGDFVSAETHIPCTTCFQCRTGNAHICENMAILGVDTNGAFAEYIAIPAVDIWKNDREKINPDFASVQEPLGNAVDTVLSEPVVGKTVLVTGCGPIGLLAIGVARVSGASLIIATDLNEYRLDIAKKMGADLVLNPTKDDVHAKVLELTNGMGVDVAVEMAGAPATIDQCLKLTVPGGRVSLLGLPAGPVKIDLTNDVVFKGLRIYGITGRKMFDTWYKVSRLLASGRLDISPVVTHTFKFEQFQEAFELMESGNSGKIILKP